LEFLLGGKFWETGHKNIVSGMVNKTIVWAPFAGRKGGSGWLGDGVVGVLGGEVVVMKMAMRPRRWFRRWTSALGHVPMPSV
jgi:hypothetical protein